VISPTDLSQIALARVKDAEALLRAKRFDGAVYLTGYSVELSLKARVCRTLRWAGYPQTNAEFESLRTFRTHDLDLLLRLSGCESRIKTKYFADWSSVAQWRSDARYRPVGSAKESDARQMISAAKRLLRRL
jgi:HEPN domain-containing protein